MSKFPNESDWGIIALPKREEMFGYGYGLVDEKAVHAWSLPFNTELIQSIDAEIKLLEKT